MIRTIRRLVATDGGDNKEWIELTMLSSDAKPTSGIINGSIATEVDTGKVFFFDETAGEWGEQFSFQNAGGGGSGGGNMFFVTFSWDDDADGGNGGYVCDKTYAEIKAAYNGGKVLLSKEDGGEWGSQYGFGTITPVNFQAYYMYADTGSISVRKYNVSSSDVVTVTDFVATATES